MMHMDHVTDKAAQMAMQDFAFCSCGIPAMWQLLQELSNMQQVQKKKKKKMKKKVVVVV